MRDEFSSSADDKEDAPESSIEFPKNTKQEKLKNDQLLLKCKAVREEFVFNANESGNIPDELILHLMNCCVVGDTDSTKPNNKSQKGE